MNSSTNNQYIFILPQQQQQMQNSSSTTYEDDVDCNSTNSSDCESIKLETITPTESLTSTTIESPSKVWRPW